MPETTEKGKTKKKVSWLEDSPEAEGPVSQGPGAGERNPAPSGGDSPDATTGKVPRVPAPGGKAAKGASGGSLSTGDLPGRIKANPVPLAFALFALLILCGFFWFFVLRVPGESATRGSSDEPSGAEGGSMLGAARVPDDPFSGGEVRDSGVVFGAMQVEDGEASLSGSGLEWSGTVTKKEGVEGETVTLEGPTAAQLERGFDLGESSVETGVYAIAQESGEVLHVSTHTYLPREAGDQSGELTLGTIYALQDGRNTGYAYYLDERRQQDSNQVTRTYVRPGQKSYRVSYEAQPGTFVPLLIGWQGFEKDDSPEQEE